MVFKVVRVGLLLLVEVLIAFPKTNLSLLSFSFFKHKHIRVNMKFTVLACIACMYVSSLSFTRWFTQTTTKTPILSDCFIFLLPEPLQV